MRLLIALISCLFYTLCSGQTNTAVAYPTLGPVHSVIPNNDSQLNFTFIYPKNYTFDVLYVRFTLYDFIGNATLNPQEFPFSWLNFTNSNTSLAWVATPPILQPSDYIMGCFEWLQTTVNNALVADTTQCILTRATQNSTTLPIASPMTTKPVVTNTSITVWVYYPAGLPYNQINIVSTVNGTIAPSMTNSTSNGTYVNMTIFSYMNLTPGCNYNLCVGINSANSKINGSQTSNHTCLSLNTLNNYSPNTTTIPPMTTSTISSSNKNITNWVFIILLFIFALI